MDFMEKLLENADFSKETTQKNQLFYELFGKPVPIAGKEGITLLGSEELGLVAGGRSIQKNGPEKETDGE